MSTENKLSFQYLCFFFFDEIIVHLLHLAIW